MSDRAGFHLSASSKAHTLSHNATLPSNVQMRNVSKRIQYCSLGIEAYRFHGKGHKAGEVRKRNLGLLPRSESCLVGTHFGCVTTVGYSSCGLFHSFSVAKSQWNSLRFLWTLRPGRCPWSSLCLEWSFLALCLAHAYSSFQYELRFYFLASAFRHP